MEGENQKLQEQEGSQTNPQPARTPVGFPQAPKEKKSKTPLIIAIILVVLLGVAGWWFFGKEETLEENDAEVSPTPFVAESTPTPKVEIDRDEVKIQVLNGTGITGAAGALQKELEGLGYSQVDVGNAQKQDFKATEVIFDSGVSLEVKDEITEKLEGLYQDVEVKVGSVDRYDIKITTGYPKGHTPTPTEKPKATLTPTPSGSLTPTITVTQTPTPTPTQVP
ncbi:hypothetical protein A2865_03035 [Candidatus Woesebacteria bacterium RIFCSPHIGHO2_01_FULL_39_17]|uniref:Beta-mannanase/endoglucanase A n=3 Tax=Candidatus Woeseibacteriota TaxID=1752722 RepID=A0A0G0NDJ8_9BACT|nr:MAG: Beta-mannanase/endoglucanase A [Microgenomates group bacterium GW2011_GWC1_38_12]KKQ94120.1 MAG: Beta-mannanase/endoglucanase A [Candidatus Woesebacteria bacterium GW2011_GWB1_39_10b]KKR13578.1 MAG: Beta-mannanase/endoglucanase A [Candidatus Woesebacteria bacterium GW2011_GWA1_39_21b]OGM22537.1 MAG: hypothetical protein A2865_03035 [Candidatus Woesebacteria bacterium RIFCSPHIGHO2_01_FULL_39_17]OGM63661.1 MAG: hypothetical protein A3A52_02450 [Candidatus Woesebacteria bacterium RIFCSPLOW